MDNIKSLPLIPVPECLFVSKYTRYWYPDGEAAKDSGGVLRRVLVEGLCPRHPPAFFPLWRHGEPLPDFRDTHTTGERPTHCWWDSSTLLELPPHCWWGTSALLVRDPHTAGERPRHTSGEGGWGPPTHCWWSRVILRSAGEGLSSDADTTFSFFSNLWMVYFTY